MNNNGKNGINNNTNNDMYANWNGNINNNNSNNINNNANTSNNMYTSYNKGVTNITKSEEKPYIVMTDEEIKKGKKKNGALVTLIYGVFVIIAGMIFYMYRIDKYEFYLKTKEVVIANDSTYQVELIPKRAEYFDYLNYKYEIEDERVASVNEYGEVKGKEAGETNLKIRYKYGIEYKIIKIKTEDINVESIEIKDEKGGKITEGESNEIKAVINGDEKLNKDVKCRSSDERVVTVNEGCKTVNPIGEGEASIIAESEEEETRMEVKVEEEEVEVERIEIENSIIRIKKGTSGQIVARVKPENASKKRLTYKSDNENVRVDENGKVYGEKLGRSIITITSENGRKGYCTVEVEEESKEIKEIIIKEKEIEITEGEEYQLGIEISPSEVTEREVIWESSNQNIARVENGKVEGIRAGEAEIKVRTKDGKVSSTCKVEVKAKEISVERIKVEETKVKIEVGSKYSIGVEIEPRTATNKKLTYQRENDNIVVDETGMVTGKKIGKSKVTVTSSNGKKAEIEIEVVEKKVEPSGIEIAKEKIEIKVGESEQIIAKIKPEEATVRTITWTSSNKSVVTVTNGKIVGQGGGEARITAMTANGKTATCIVVVKVPVNKVIITGEESVIINKTTQYKASVEPNNATDKSISWSSSNTSVAKVDGKGKVTGVKVGTAKITARSSNGKESSKLITVKAAKIEVSTIEISPKTIEIIEGEVTNLIATIKPTEASDKRVTWTSSNTSIATVNEKGIVTGKKAGTVTITGKSSNGKIATASVKVKPGEVGVTGISLNITSATLSQGETLHLKEKIEPANATNKKVTWTSSNTNVAKVDTNGTVTAGKVAGTAKITVRSSNGKTGICTILVKANTYTVTYAGNGGTYKGASTWTDPKKAVYNQNYTTYSNKNFFVRAGYTFTGWNEKVDGKGVSWTNWIDKPWKWTYDHNVTLYAQWKANGYIATLDANGGSIDGKTSKAISVTYESTVNLENYIPTRAGYTFEGWYGKSGTKYTTFTWKFTTNDVFYAHWKANTKTYIATLDANGGSIDGKSSKTISVTYGSTVNLENYIPTRAGYTFEGWYGKSGTKYTTFTWKFTTNDVFYAHWRANETIDLVLFWGQSNMVGAVGRYDNEKIKDPRDISGIISNDIIQNYTSMNHVNVPVIDNTAFQFLEIDGARLEKITSSTNYLGETISYKNGKMTKEVLGFQKSSLQKSYGTNMIPEFANEYYRKTGHKVVAVMAAHAGQPISKFLPNDTEFYIYDAMKQYYLDAVKYLESHGYKIKNKFYVVFQGCSDADENLSNGNDYYNKFMKVHNNLKKDLGLSFGAIVYTSGRIHIKNSCPACLTYVKNIHNQQVNLVKNNSDIVLGSDWGYKAYLNDKTNAFCPVDSKLQGQTVDNSIHFTSASLSQIGREVADNVIPKISK